MKSTLPYQLICSDIDGTLLDKNRDISAETAETFARITKKIPVILASSRMPSAMRYLQEKLGITGAPLIAYNGGLIIGKNGEVLQDSPLRIELLEAVLDHQQNHDYNISTYCDDSWRTEREDEWTLREINNTRVKPALIAHSSLLQELESCSHVPHKVMCMGAKEELDDLLKLLIPGFSDAANFYRSKDTYLEITAKNIDKSVALKWLIEKEYGLEMKDVMAFGDNHNDEQLLSDAGFGVAVANATENVKMAADYTSPFTNKEHAVAKALQEFLLKD